MATIDIEELDRTFYPTYGRAMGAWAQLESSLCDLFIRTARTRSGVGNAIFFSVHSFRARMDMLGACVDFAVTTPAGKAFIKSVRGLANDYAQTRNRLAHDAHAIDFDETLADPEVKRVIRRAWAGADDMTVEEVHRAGVSFAQLAITVQVSLGGSLLRAPELSNALLDRLPRDPTQTGLSQSDLNARLIEITRY